MASSKTLYLRASDEEIGAALAMVKSPAFEKLLVFARAEYFQKFYANSDQTKAVNDFVAVMINLPEDENPIPEVESGLQHDLSVPDRTKPTTT